MQNRVLKNKTTLLSILYTQLIKSFLAYERFVSHILHIVFGQGKLTWGRGVRVVVA